jgi:hypothetical protein
MGCNYYPELIKMEKKLNQRRTKWNQRIRG